jgi:hypothetical protein
MILTFSLFCSKQNQLKAVQEQEKTEDAHHDAAINAIGNLCVLREREREKKR